MNTVDILQQKQYVMVDFQMQPTVTYKKEKGHETVSGVWRHVSDVIKQSGTQQWSDELQPQARLIDLSRVFEV